MMTTENEYDETFLDATDNLQLDPNMDLLSCVEDVVGALELFINDKCIQAMKKMEHIKETSIYHSLGDSFLNLMQAFLSYEPDDIDSAIKVMKLGADVCNKYRHPSSITNNAVTKMVMRPNYATYTELEIHAELCYAECLLGRALVTFIQDDNLVSFIRGGLRIRTSYMLYKECEFILEHRAWPNKKLRDHFASGVYLGLGMFNLIIASLPKRILKLLEFIGFSGDMHVALEMLDKGHQLQTSLRGVLCTLLNLFYHCGVRYILGKEVDNISYFDKLVVPLLKKYPEGSITLFLAGRVKSLRGDITSAVSLMQTSLNGQVEWNKFRQFSHWDLSLFTIFLGDYRTSLKHIETLRTESTWSKAIYTYLKAAVLNMCDDATSEDRREMIQLMEQVPNLKQRLVGKSLPPEKFVCMKAERFLTQNNWLFLPAFELLYVWNYFLMLKGNVEVLDTILAKVNRAIEELNDDSHRGVFLKGVCLSYMGSPLSAEELFIEVYENQKSMNGDQYLVSCSLVELGVICMQTTNYDQAVQYFTLAKKHALFYTEFRIHMAMQEIELKLSEA